VQFNWKSIQKPIFALSPMADMTDSAYCQAVKTVASPIVFREMVSAEAVVRGNDKTLGMTKIHPAERPIIQQIFGADPITMAKSASIINRDFQPEGIDINMGCPVYKITSNFNGSALMKDAELAKKIVKSMKAVIDIPLSVKIRAGWSEHTECIEFAKHLEDAGADLITVHGRTKTQGYAGFARRDVVAEVKKAISIPVLYNGDVFTAEEAFKAVEQTGCDGALIARGALGNPWIFAQIEDIQSGKAPREVSFHEKVNMVIKHLGLHIEEYGPKGVVTFRKHLSWYFKGIPHFKDYKVKLMSASSQQEVVEVLENFQQNLITVTTS
jgi:tRNA-dihydrouridine synthase B